MRFLDNTKIGPKLIGGFLLVAALLVGLGFTGSTKIHAIDEADTRLYEKMTVPLGEVGSSMQNFQQQRVFVRDAIMTGDAEKFGSRIKDLDAQQVKTEESFQKTILTDEGKEVFRKYKDASQRYDKTTEKILELVSVGKAKEAESLLRLEGSKIGEEVTANLGALQAMKMKLAKQTSDDNTVMADGASRQMYLIMGIAVLFSIVIGWILTQSITNPLKQGVDMMKEMAKGHLGTRLKMDRNDEIGDLARAMDGFTDDLQAVSKVLQQVAAGDLSAQMKEADSQDEVRLPVKAVLTNLNGLIGDMNHMSTQHDAGDIDVKIPTDKYQASYQKMAAGVNDMVFGHIAVKKKAMACIAELGNGNFDVKLETFPGKKVFINDTIEKMRGNIRTFIADMNHMSAQHDAGDIDVKIPADKFQGDFHKMATGVNDMVFGHIAVKKKAMACLKAFGEGDFEAPLEKFPGKKAFINDTIEQVRVNLKALIADAHMLSRAAVDGKLATRADATKHQGDFRKIVQGVNECLDAVIGPLNVAAGYVDRISKGDIPPKITDKYNGDFNEIKNNLNQCVDAVNALVADAGTLNKAAVEGKLATRADASKHQGDFRKVVQGVNDCLDAVIGPLNVAAGYVDRISKGDIPPKITDKYNGDFNEIKNNLNQCVDAVNALVADAGTLNKAAVEGKLATRADASKHQGDFRKVVQGVNDCLDAVIGPLNVSAGYVDRISKGDIPPKITDKYNGDFNEIKNNLNQCIDAVNALVADAGLLRTAAVEGKLATRADATRHQGDYRKVVQGVNDCLDAVIGPLNVTAGYVDQISKGVIPPIITDNYNGDFNIIKNNLNNMVKMMSDLLAQTDIIIQGAADGQLDKRANADMFVGGWNQLVKGVNQAITNIVDPMNVTADYVDKVAKGIIPPTITTEYKGQYNVIKVNLNNMVKMMSDLLAQTDIIIQGAADGQLDKRANADLFVGGWNQLVKGVNAAITNIVDPMNVTADYVDKVAKGIISTITTEYKGQYNVIKVNLNNMVKMMSDLLAQTDIIIQGAADGQLDKRANADMFVGGWNQLVKGVNAAITNIVDPMNVTADYVDKVAKGIIPPTITTEYKGQYNVIKINLNNMVKMMSDLLAQTDIIIQGAADGQLDKRANADMFVGGWNQLVKGVNQAITNIVDPMNVTADYVDKVAKGIIPPTITTEYKGQYNVIKNNLNNMVKMMSDLLAQTDIIIQGAADGQLDKRANADMFVGGWNQLVKGVNAAITNIVDPMNVTADYVDKVAKGIIPPTITTEYKGQYNVIKGNLNNMVAMMTELLTETDTLVKAAIGGQLSTRATATKFVGGWFQLVDGVNKTLDAVIAPLNVTASYVDRIGKGEVPPKITDHYNGDFNTIKGSINSCIDGLQGLVEANNVIQRMAANDFTVQVEGKYMGIFQELGKALNETIVQMREALVQVQEGAVAIASASGEIAMGNQDLSSRTEEQAANLEETASGLEQITSNVNLTADNAQSANQEAVKARQVAQDGGTAVTQVIAAMESINESSAKINEIIGVVDEIAFQTNLLALNAAVEAARAGEQGRGFAVVAAEVRNLAKRSADAAKEIKVLIRESVAKSVDGSKVAAHAGETIQEVVANVQRVTALVGEIANATQEQSTGLIELNKAVVQMDEVTQQNAALVEEAAAAAETLDGQAHNLAEVVSRFKTGTESRRTETTRAAAHPGASRRAQPSQRKAAACEPAPKSPAKAAAPAPRLGNGKPHVDMPKGADDGQWESF